MKTAHSRRDFLRVTAAGALGAFALTKLSGQSSSPAFSAMHVDLKRFGVGLQLYTIRDAMDKDVAGIIKESI